MRVGLEFQTKILFGRQPRLEFSHIVQDSQGAMLSKQSTPGRPGVHRLRKNAHERNLGGGRSDRVIDVVADVERLRRIASSQDPQ